MQQNCIDREKSKKTLNQGHQEIDIYKTLIWQRRTESVTTEHGELGQVKEQLECGMF